MRKILALFLGLCLVVGAASTPTSFAEFKVNGKDYVYGKTQPKTLKWDEWDNLLMTEKSDHFYLRGEYGRGKQKSSFELYFPKTPGNYVCRRDPDTWKIEVHMNFSSNAGLNLGSYHVDARQEDYAQLSLQLEEENTAWHGTLAAKLHKYSKKEAGERYVQIAQRDAAEISGQFYYLKSKIRPGTR